MHKPVFHKISSKTLRDSFQPQSDYMLSAIENVRNIQRDKLFNTLRINTNSRFGKEHTFVGIKTIDDFRRRVSIYEYNDYHPYVQRIKAGERQILTEENVVCLEPTSGSTSCCKFIPYTESLYRDFQNGIAPWLYHLYQNKRIADGLFYWSITPALKSHANGKETIPVGTSNDFAYFTKEQQNLLLSRSAVPFTINHITSMDEFKKWTLMHLLQAERLSFISVWNPSYLTTLLDYFVAHADVILSSLPPSSRKVQLIQHWKQHYAYPAAFFLDLWPNLTLVSCWTDANAEYYTHQISTYLPGIPIQGKGLISTEAFTSFPLPHLPGHLLSITSHFFEFKPIDQTDNTYLAHELETGKQYEVIVTTSGGFYRYNTHDIIEVIGHHKQAPLLKFKGRNQVIDHVGEKINELQLSAALNQLLNSLLRHTSFLLCAPERNEQGAVFYTVFLATQDNEDALHAFSNQLEDNLMRHFHYRYARQLGQLDRIRLYKIHDAQPHAIYLARHFQEGKKLGQVKPAYIDKATGWSTFFRGEWF